MKIVFAATGKNWDSLVDSRFGRAEGYTLYDEEKDELSWHSNAENKSAGHGAGVQAGQKVASLGADIVVTGGSFGPKAGDVIRAAGIEMIPDVGEITLKEAYSKIKK
jgi:predicted Fe-Mo cluster-binding NifX family protein